MKLLLDSHTFIFFTQQPTALPARAREAIEDPANTRLLSLVSPWELQIKASLGKLTIGKPLRDLIQFELDRGSMSLLPITLAHIDELSRLPLHHRDPFDRLLIAQAVHEGLTFVTADHNIGRYPVPCLWE